VLAVDIPYKVYRLLGNLGFKIYFFRLPINEKTNQELLECMSGRFSKKKTNIQSALYEYLGWFEIGPDLIHDEQSGLYKMQWDDEKDGKEAKNIDDKDKVEKSHYHYRYVCCIGSRSTNNSSSIKKTFQE
jgi:hypothetical protein